MMQHEQRGFSLIEVLIALLITAVGILGVAGLQVVSLQQNRDALLRDQASQAGSDILDQMRANPETDYSPVAIDAAPSSNVNCVNNPCTRDQMAEYDIAIWKCRINPLDEDNRLYPVCDGFGIQQASLPGGRAAIGKDGNIHEVTIEWVNDREGNTNSIILRTQTKDT